MSTPQNVAAPLPMTRPNPFDPPEELAELRRSQPLSRMSYPDGHTGWLVTTHALARTVLTDPRFSARLELTHRPIFENEFQARKPDPAPPGMFLTMTRPAPAPAQRGRTPSQPFLTNCAHQL
jgi:hypothetical protein